MSEAGRWAQVTAVFQDALERDERARASYLDTACAGDGALRAEVESLLAAHQAAGRFAERSPLAALPLSAVETLGLRPGLAPGSHLGSYEIAAPLGAGGMGEVYRARDAALNRDVAVKVLPDLVAHDSDRLARFKREAQILAALNHPNIVTVHSVEEERGVHFITMELVSGETLAALLPRNGFALDRFFDIAIPLADAVAAAHAQGIVHRDLKPANVMVTPEGRVKVLDFGLARPTMSAAHGPGDVTAAPMTEWGAVVGTRGYLSPEQARGQVVDARSDIFALGIILFEMLTGRRPFAGDTPTDVLSSVIKDDAPLISAIRAGLPRELSRIVRRCLAKDPARRLQSALDLRNELEDLRRDLDSGELVSEVRSVPGMFRWSRAIWPTAALVAVLIAAVIGWIATRPTAGRVPRLQNPRQVTFAVGAETQPSWSPDGGRIAYTAAGDIWIVHASGGPTQNLTRDPAGSNRDPAWSPDGSQIAFVSGSDVRGVYLIPAIGGSPNRISPTEPAVEVTFAAPQWSADGSQVAYLRREGFGHFIEIVSLRDRQSRRLRVPGDAGNRFDLSWSPDGRFFAYVRAPQRNEGISRLWVFRTSDERAVPVTDGRWNDWSPTWSPDSQSLFYISNRGGTMDLWQQHVTETGDPDGDPIAVTIGIGIQQAVFSRDGRKLVYSQGRPVAHVWRVPILEDREAGWEHAEQLTSDQAHIDSLDVDPVDERFLVVSSDRGGNSDLWAMAVHGTDITQLTTDPTPDRSPRLSPDGKRVAYFSYQRGSRDVWVMPSDGGPATQITSDPGSEMGPSWSPDGQHLAFYADREGRVSDGFVVPLGGGEPQQILKGPSRYLQWSPNGEWIGFVSGLTARRFARVLASGGAPEEWANDVWGFFRWSRDGTRVYFPRDRELWELTLADGKERRLTLLSRLAGSLVFNALAVGKAHLYFTWSSDLGDIWVMDVARDDE